MANHNFVPLHLDWATNNPVSTKEIHSELSQEFYQMLNSIPLANNQFRITCEFFSLNEQGIDTFSNILNINIEKDPHCLWLMSNWILNPPSMLTRDDRGAITGNFLNVELNNRLKLWHQQRLTQAGQQPVDLPSLFDSFHGFVTKIANLMKFLIIKTFRARDLYKYTISWTEELASLGAAVSGMLLGAITRREVYDKSSTLLERRTASVQAFNTYLDYSIANIQTSLSIFSTLEYATNYHYTFLEFERTIRNKYIWTNHHFQYENQLKHILNDPTIAPMSAKLDTLIEKVHSYSPDATEQVTFKASRLKNRVQSFIYDYEAFVNEEVNDESRSNLLLDTCKFILEQAEGLSLQGIDFIPENIGVNRSRLEKIQVDIQKSISEMKKDLNKRDIEAKMAQNEMSKGLKCAQLPFLKSPTDWLSWINSYRRIKTQFKSDIARMSLIKQSLVKDFERSRIDQFETSEQCVEFLLGRYGNSLILIPLMLKKLMSLPKAVNESILMKNFDQFDKTIKLLEKNKLLIKLDQFVIEQILGIVLMPEARKEYFRETLVKEAGWKTEAGLDTQINHDSDELILQTNPLLETIRRDHFIAFARTNFETCRRMVSNNHFISSDFERNRQRNRTNVFSTNFQQSPNKKFYCPFKCGIDHTPFMLKCPEFSKLSPFEKFQKLKNNRNICKRCLNFIKNFDNHKIIDQRCPYQKGPCQKCNNFNHSTHLHIEKQNNGQYNNSSSQSNYHRNNDQSKQNRGQSKQYRGQFKRPLRSQRFSQATKVSLSVPRQNINENEEIIEEIQNMTVNMLSFKTTPLFDNQESIVSRTFLTNVGVVRVISKDVEKSVNCLFDSASVFNFCRIDLLRDLNLKPILQWSGTVKSLCAETNLTFPLYLLPFKDKSDKIINIPVLAYDSIINRNQLNDSMFNHIVSKTGINKERFVNTSSTVSILLGLRSQRHHPYPIRVKDDFHRLFPDLWIKSSDLCQNYFLSGSFTVNKRIQNPSTHTLLTFIENPNEQKVKCHFNIYTPYQKNYGLLLFNYGLQNFFHKYLIRIFFSVFFENCTQRICPLLVLTNDEIKSFLSTFFRNELQYKVTYNSSVLEMQFIYKVIDIRSHQNLRYLQQLYS